MNQLKNRGRRMAIRKLLLGAGAMTLTGLSRSEEASLLNEDDPAAKAVHYVSDASRAKEAAPGSKCANCSLYSGDSKSTQASCALFSNKQVLANGWCSSWTNM